MAIRCALCQPFSSVGQASVDDVETGQAERKVETNTKGCDGLSPDSIAVLQKIADRDGKTLEDMCASVIS